MKEWAGVGEAYSAGAVAGAGALLASLGPDARRNFRIAFDEVVEERHVDGALLLEHRAAIAVGTLI